MVALGVILGQGSSLDIAFFHIVFISWEYMDTG